MRVVEAARDAVDRFVVEQSREMRLDLARVERRSRAARERRARQRLRGGTLPEWLLVQNYYQHYGRDAGEASRCRIRLFADPAGVAAPVVTMSQEPDGLPAANYVEEVASVVREAYALPPQTIWISHVPECLYSPAIAGFVEMYQVVTFSPDTVFEGLSEAQVAWVKTLQTGERRRLPAG